MARFSERIGKKKPKNIQFESIDEDLRNSLWNLVLKWMPSFEGNKSYYWKSLAKEVAIEITKTPTDLDIFKNYIKSHRWLKEIFYSDRWWLAYDILEYLIIFLNSRHKYYLSTTPITRITQDINRVLEKELSGYRFINEQLAPVTTNSEILTIEDALENSISFGLNGVTTHLETALDLLSTKPEPDFRNSIKESISAVEAATKLISDSKNGGLKPSLQKLSSKIEIHKSLEEGFIKLYGFTSDSDGIRHSIMDQPNVDFHDAKYMLVACSAFVNYLIGKASDAGLLQTNDQ